MTIQYYRIPDSDADTKRQKRIVELLESIAMALGVPAEKLGIVSEPTEEDILNGFVVIPNLISDNGETA